MVDMTARTSARRRRADAERSIGAIVEAAVESFRRRPDVTMSEIASAAGVGRVTLYAHFPSREALVEAVTKHVLA
jgi:TetR/AcrR family transcriptional repressor of mexCD-oprJ operon